MSSGDPCVPARQAPGVVSFLQPSSGIRPFAASRAGPYYVFSGLLREVGRGDLKSPIQTKKDP